MLLIGCYAIAYATGDADEDVAGFSGALRWLDFGSGQERGIRAEQREKLAARQAQKLQENAAAEEGEKPKETIES